MAYIVTRNNKSGYVALVEKQRVLIAGGKTSVRNVGYVCGLGVMTRSEFEEFRAWAHGITHQESRKQAVLACPRVVKKTEKTTTEIAEAQQKKTTVKRPPRVKKVVDDTEKLKTRVIREKEWFAALTPEQKKEYKEKQTKRLKEDVKELKDKFKSISQIHTPVKALPVYEIRDLTRAQEFEAEIKTLKGEEADKSLIQEREKHIRSILGKKYKSCRDVAIAAKKGEVLIND